MTTINEHSAAIGFCGHDSDPPRPEARTAVQEAHNGGIRVIMITGDHPRTAARIAAELDVVESGGRVVTGAEIADMDDDELADIAAEVNVFARVDPEHKLRLVRALQRNGQVTAMTGDGVDDAPALKHADIGVAMGLGDGHGWDRGEDQRPCSRTVRPSLGSVGHQRCSIETASQRSSYRSRTNRSTLVRPTVLSASEAA